MLYQRFYCPVKYGRYALMRFSALIGDVLYCPSSHEKLNYSPLFSAQWSRIDQTIQINKYSQYVLVENQSSVGGEKAAFLGFLFKSHIKG